jgi:hypothetical protein
VIHHILGVDPDTRALGWGACRGDELVAAGLVRAGGLEQMMRRIVLRDIFGEHSTVNVLVVERAEVYKGGAPDPNKLGQLLLVAGAVVGAVGHVRVRLPFPKEWKRQVPKEIHHRRLLEGLTVREHRVLDAALGGVPLSLRHNVLDGVGLAKWGAQHA